MIEVVYKRCYKEPLLTDAGVAELNRLSGGSFTVDSVPRDNPTLVAMAKNQNEDFMPSCADVRVAELPDGSQWSIRTSGRFPEWIAVQ